MGSGTPFFRRFKHCSKCGVFKDYKFYRAHVGGKYGLHSWCRKCQKLHKETMGEINGPSTKKA